MRNVSDKLIDENKKNAFFGKSHFFFENRAFYEIIWNIIADSDRPQMTI